MHYNNKYTNAINKLDTSDEFKKRLIETIKEEESRKVGVSMKIRSKIVGIISALGIISIGGVAFAVVMPEEWKTNLTNLINTYFGTEISSDEYNAGVQDKTFENIVNSDNKSKEKYSQLLDADIYDIGDSNVGTLIESNYEQYNFNVEYDEGEITKKKYSDIISIKMAMINYGCLEKLDIENTILDSDGNVIERNESAIEDTVKYQYNEFNRNWDDYYFGEDEFNEKLYYKITGMTLMNGNNKTDEDYYNYSRAKKIKITFNGEDEEIINLLDSSEAQFIDLSYIQYDISKPVEINVEVLETYKGTESNDVYIADIQFGIESNIPMGR